MLLYVSSSKNNKGKTVLLIISILVDNILIARRAEDIAWFKSKTKKQFKIKKSIILAKHLGIIYSWDQDHLENCFVLASMDD